MTRVTPLYRVIYLLAAGSYRVGLSEKLPPCLMEMEPNPAGAKTDLPLAKAELISGRGGTSRITDLRRKRNLKSGCS